MTDNYRLERVERLLHELKHEITRGMMEGDLPDEEFHFRFVVPVSKAIPGGVVDCRFETRPTLHMFAACEPPGLKIVKS